MNNFISKINETNVNNMPYKHLFIKNIFPEDFYDKLSHEINKIDIELFKVDHFYFGGVHRNSIKIINNIDDSNYLILKKHKNQLGNLLHVVDYFFENEKRIITSFSDKIPTPRMTDSRYIYFSIVKDNAKYYIEPHTDASQNIYTMLLYTPLDSKNKKYGLEMYEKKNDKFIVKKTIDFLQNRLILFAPLDNTWHGVKTRDYVNGSRNSLQIFFLIKK